MRRFHFDSTDSTNTQARRLAADHVGEPLAVTAAVQTAGRGRQGRFWSSPLGGAWLSMAWPARREPTAYAGASLAAAAAVCRALLDVAPETDAELRIKWPNDMLLAGRKVAGILCEQLSATDGRAGTLIIGVGVNVDFDLALLPADLRHPPTTLRAATGRAIAVDAVLDAVVRRIGEALTQLDADGLTLELVDELRSRLAYVGAMQTWTSLTRSVTGCILGLDDAGRLLFETAAGAVIACDSGELVIETL
jgi:BirA family transcriptional regulator, biotin operon repressor / biotin---[acetyl-CoA-carboxylase] ligase